jgi:hypothetical protein
MFFNMPFALKVGNPRIAFRATDRPLNEVLNTSRLGCIGKRFSLMLFYYNALN